MKPVGLTWEEVRVRSEEKLGDMVVFCCNCAMVFPHSQLPCRQHATPEESKAIDDMISRQLASMPLRRSA